MTIVDPASASPVQALSGNQRLWSVLCHLSVFFGFPFLLPLVVYLVMRKDEPYVAHHAREALNFHLSLLIYLLACIPLYFILVGFPLAVAIGVLAVVCSILGAIKASEGYRYQYPFTIRLVKA